MNSCKPELCSQMLLNRGSLWEIQRGGPEIRLGAGG